VIHRGDIRWVDFPPPTGSEPGYRRPVLIVSSDRFNRSAINTVLAVTITSNLRLADSPGNVALPGRMSGLDRDSVINVSQFATVNKSDLSDTTGRVDVATMRMVDEGMGLILDLCAGH
jgi:mRNA interferase MazF